MRIRGQELNVNIEEELQHIDFKHSKIRDNKLQACSPFRDERKPSFAINLENGTWIDSGATQDHMKKGNLVSFLALINDTTYEAVEDYLIDKYGIDFNDTSKLKINVNLGSIINVLRDPKDFVAEFSYSRYLDKIRGIDPIIQSMFKTFETTKDGKNVVGIGWHNKNGDLLNIKYRCTDNKTFFYEEGGDPIKNHLYGYYEFIKYCKEIGSTLYIVESEIDCMYLWSLGYYAVALGRASYNIEQLKLLYRSGAVNIVIATDNDAVGNAVANSLINELIPFFKVYRLKFPSGKKDVNDLTPEELRVADRELCKIKII